MPRAATRVRVPVMLHRWAWISFLHWRYDASEVQALLPSHLEVETFDGSAWVGLTPFLLSLRAPHTPSFVHLSDLPEMNVRTYVRAPDASTGIWFFSLDVSRLAAAIGARLTYGLPYFWSEFRVTAGDRHCRYQCRRLWPAPPARTQVEVQVGESVGTAKHDLELAEFLTARWRLYTRIGPALWQAAVEHPPWPLQRAHVARWETTHLAAAGLPSPVEPPVAHWSGGVEVKVGPPTPVTGGQPRSVVLCRRSPE